MYVAFSAATFVQASMTPPRPDDILPVPAPGFPPLRLCLDDVLPVSMVLLLGYDYRLEPSALRAALHTALQAFPHLGARIRLNLQPLQADLVPGDRPVALEWIRAGEPAPQALETLDQDTLFARYAPSAAALTASPLQALQAPLLQLRLTWLPEREACVLGLMVSHMALDGIGLALFLEHLVAALRGGSPPAVVHDRRLTFPENFPADTTLPPQYREVPNLMALASGQDPSASTRATVFSVPVAGVEQVLGKSSLTEARLFLAAHLGRETALLQPGLRSLALWCNARGLGQVPRNYTGNAGCYVPIPLAAGDAQSIFGHLKRSITRTGFAEISATYARLKAAEASGRYVFWNGPGDDLLSLNLVPHIRGAADFGRGTPVYAQLLTRNVSGLRIYNNPAGDDFVVEACLPGGQGDGLGAACERLGLPVRPWHRPSARIPA